MRKKKSNSKKWFVIIVIAIIVLMVGSSLLIGLDSDNPSQLKYNDHRFTYKNNQWTTVINNYEVNFYYHPSELDYINLTNPENFNVPLIYVSFDPNETNEYIDLSRLKLDLAGQLTNTYFSHGLTKLSEDYDLPQITCQNATPYTPVITYQKSNETSISYKNNCYTLNAQSNIDFLKLTERIIYQILGVING